MEKNLIFDGTSGLKLERCHIKALLMTSPIFFCFEKFLAYALFLLSFIVVRPQMAKLNWGLFATPHPL